MYEELLQRVDKNSIEMLESLRILFEDSKKPKVFNRINNFEEDEDYEESEEDLFSQINVNECKYISDDEVSYGRAEEVEDIISDFDEEELQEEGNDLTEDIYVENDDDVLHC